MATFTSESPQFSPAYATCSSFRLDLVAIGLVLRLELEVLMGGTEEHFTVATTSVNFNLTNQPHSPNSPDFDPVLVVSTAQ